MSGLTISVVIPVHNGGQDLHQCLDAMAASAYPVFECVIVDDASDDGSAQQCADRPNTRVIRLPTQQGPSIARNRGVAEATGDIIFFVDADVMVHPDTLATGARILQSDSNIAAVFGSYDDEPGHRSFLSQYRNLLHHWVHQTALPEATTFWTGCGAVRREAFIETGGFEQSIRRPSIEDIEFGSRLCAAGYRIRLEKKMQCKHLKQWNFWNLVNTDIFHRGVPWMVLILTNRDAPNDLNINYSARIATVLASLLILTFFTLILTGHAVATLPGLMLILITAVFSFFTVKPKINSALTVALAISAPLVTFALLPDLLGLIPLMLISTLVWTQFGFYRYVSRKRNCAFAFAVIPMQVIFFTGCAVSTVLGFMVYAFYELRGLPAR